MFFEKHFIQNIWMKPFIKNGWDSMSLTFDFFFFWFSFFFQNLICCTMKSNMMETNFKLKTKENRMNISSLLYLERHCLIVTLLLEAPFLKWMISLMNFNLWNCSLAHIQTHTHNVTVTWNDKPSIHNWLAFALAYVSHIKRVKVYKSKVCFVSIFFCSFLYYSIEELYFRCCQRKLFYGIIFLLLLSFVVLDKPILDGFWK